MNTGSQYDQFTPKKLGGLKIVDNKLNKRVSDIFNVRNEIKYDDRNYYLENKIKTAQVVEERMDNKLKNIAPYFGGQKNPNFKNQGEIKKFDLRVGNIDENSRLINENQEKKKFEGITKMKNSFKKYSNLQDDNSDKSPSKNVNTSYNLRNSQNFERANKTYNENSNLKDRSYSPISHKRNEHIEGFLNEKSSQEDQAPIRNLSYFDEFNKKNNEIRSSRIQDKSQKRLEQTNKVAEKLLKNPIKVQKEILQNGPHTPFEDKLTRDYIKDKAFQKTMEMEEIRSKIVYRDEKRNEIYQYWDMNSKLIDKSSDNKDRRNNFKEDAILYKEFKELSVKVMKDDKIKSTFDNKFHRGEGGNKKITEFYKMERDLSKIQIKKNIIAKEQESERKLIRSKTSIEGRNLFQVKEY